MLAGASCTNHFMVQLDCSFLILKLCLCKLLFVCMCVAKNVILAGVKVSLNW